MSTSVDANPVCNCNENERGACLGQPSYQFKGKPYCLLHFPGEDKDRDGAFTRALEEKLQTKNYNFRGGWFPNRFSCDHSFDDEANFSNAVFNGEADFSNAVFEKTADFSSARFRKDGTFENAIFKNEANFLAANFNARASFGEANFGGHANFYDVIFGEGGGTSFRTVTFNNGVSFEYVQFRFGVVFDYATFTGYVNFHRTSFDDYVSFKGTKENQVFSDQTKLDFNVFRILKPEQVSFRFLTLRPHWFVFADPRKYDFTKVEWWPTTDRWSLVWWRTNLKNEIKAVKELPDVEFPYDLLGTVCQRLALNYEENNSFEKASRFRYMAIDVERRKVAHGGAFWKLSWWYWLASGYGERAWKAALILIGLLLVFASIFFFGQGSDWWRSSPTPAAGTTITAARGDWFTPSQTLGPRTTTITVADTTGANASPLLGFREALLYSAGVLTLQKPEPLPNNKRAKTFVLLETILGPVQAALLALAIRRKFMR